MTENRSKKRIKVDKQVAGSNADPCTILNLATGQLGPMQMEPHMEELLELCKREAEKAKQRDRSQQNEPQAINAELQRRPFQCPHCGTRYIRESDLKKHVRIHDDPILHSTQTRVMSEMRGPGPFKYHEMYRFWEPLIDSMPKEALNDVRYKVTRMLYEMLKEQNNK